MGYIKSFPDDDSELLCPQINLIIFVGETAEDGGACGTKVKVLEFVTNGGAAIYLPGSLINNPSIAIQAFAR